MPYYGCSLSPVEPHHYPYRDAVASNNPTNGKVLAYVTWTHPDITVMVDWALKINYL